MISKGSSAIAYQRLKRVVWEITLKCNLRCSHCGSSASIDSPRYRELDIDESRKVVDSLALLGTKYVTLSGGEPFLCEHWEELARYIIQNGLDVRFVSNGSLISGKLAERLKALSRVPLVGFSLDGGRPETHDKLRNRPGLFSKVLHSINLLRGYEIPVSIITCVHKGNLSELGRMYELLQDFDIYAWQIQPALPSGRMKQHKDMILDGEGLYRIGQFIADARAKDGIRVLAGDSVGYFCSFESGLRRSVWTGCQAGLSALGIRSNGDVTGCLSLQESNSEGNVRERSLVDIWNDPDLFSYNRRFSAKDLKGNCKECELGTVCRGGCSFLAVSYTGAYHNNPFCLRFYESERSKEYIVI